MGTGRGRRPRAGTEVRPGGGREIGVLMETEAAHIRPARRADLDAGAGILAFYVTSSVATFEEDPPGLPQWQQRLDGPAERGLPFLVAEGGGAGGRRAVASPPRAPPPAR